MPTHDELMAAIRKLDKLAEEVPFESALAALGMHWPEVHLFAIRRAQLLGPFPGVTMDPLVVDALAACWLDGLAVGLVAASVREDLQ